ncbi:MAG TPA: hypothetical protein VLT62_17445 [Candidatus Methylomirabilis sp.]|nr:hypothetical protein [Candidatus Methylomirabilis sp.]
MRGSITVKRAGVLRVLGWVATLALAAAWVGGPAAAAQTWLN